MDVIMPQLGETVAEGVVTKWYKKVGDTVKSDDTLFDVETDKVSTEIPAQANGVITEILVQEGVTAKVGTRLAVIREAGDAVAAAPAAKPAVAAAPSAAPASVAATAPAARFGKASAADRLSPVVRRLIAEHQLNPAAISGTGRDGRITREDVLAVIGGGATAAASPARAALSAPAPMVLGAGDTRKPMNSVRKRTAQHLVKSWQSAPHVLQATEVDYSKVELARSVAGAAWKAREGFSLTYLPFIARAVSVALAKFPLLNSSLDGDDLVIHSRINIGIAVDLSFDGLVVPVVKDVPNKSLPQIAREINDLAQRARSNKLKPDELSGGTYTLSNSGVFGTLITAPIINQPQVAILSTDGVRKKPVVIESEQGDSIAIRPVGVLAQTFDHRALDGAYSAAFLREVKTVLETRDWVQALDS
ncbi:MAG: 2-oxo acid dehydrogenase subunit E2 [Betaproteobacteria bacterium]|nr:2-oxo acid dehydrogenase subunit E2 [Betaproteobacteria bacterium]